MKHYDKNENMILPLLQHSPPVLILKNVVKNYHGTTILLKSQFIVSCIINIDKKITNVCKLSTIK